MSIPTNQSVSVRLIEVDPETLRSLASQMEAMAKHGCLPGEDVLVPLNREIWFRFRPNITRHDIASQPAILESSA